MVRRWLHDLVQELKGNIPVFVLARPLLASPGTNDKNAQMAAPGTLAHISYPDSRDQDIIERLCLALVQVKARRARNIHVLPTTYLQLKSSQKSSSHPRAGPFLKEITCICLAVRFHHDFVEDFLRYFSWSFYTHEYLRICLMLFCFFISGPCGVELSSSCVVPGPVTSKPLLAPAQALELIPARTGKVVVRQYLCCKLSILD